MINATELRKGVLIEYDGKLWQIVDYQHVKMKRTALAKVKMKDITAGHTIERSFQSDERFTRVELDTRQMPYLYNDGDLYYFMDQETYEQVPLDKSFLEDALPYLKENDVVELSTYKDKIIDVTIPLTVELKVTHTEPGFKGDTATAGTKPATLETGLEVQVPLFINEGDILKIDTRTGSYIERRN